jgi:hypothetical protein
MSLATSRALWNRSHLDLASVGTIAQILDRGTIEDWRELYALAACDIALRQRIHHVVRTIPTPFPHLWLAALASLGEAVDYDAPLPQAVEL